MVTVPLIVIDFTSDGPFLPIPKQERVVLHGIEHGMVAVYYPADHRGGENVVQTTRDVTRTSVYSFTVVAVITGSCERRGSIFLVFRKLTETACGDIGLNLGKSSPIV